MYLFVRRYAPFAEFGGGFEGDTRTQASTAPTATARTIGVITFDQNGVQGLDGRTSGTAFLGAGKWLASKIGRKDAIVKTELSNIKKTATILEFTLHTAGANPLLPIVSPDIDTFVDIKISFDGSGYGRYTGTVRGDSFPNAEVFVVDEDGKESLLFDYRTGGGKNTGPGRLFGSHDDVVLGTFAVNVVGTGPPAPVSPVQGK